jgi:hypothetical protein
MGVDLALCVRPNADLGGPVGGVPGWGMVRSQSVPAASAEGTGHTSIAWETGLSSRHLLAGLVT